MPDISDREHAEGKAIVRGEIDAAVAANQLEDQSRAADADRSQLESDRANTETVLQHCTAQFQAFKLKPSGHEVIIDTAPEVSSLGLEADGVGYVIFSIAHRGEETGSFQGTIPLMAVRCRNDEYEIKQIFGNCLTVTTFDELRESLIDAISEINQAALQSAFLSAKGSQSAASHSVAASANGTVIPDS
jgi:hypothetical protein